MAGLILAAREAWDGLWNARAASYGRHHRRLSIRMVRSGDRRVRTIFTTDEDVFAPWAGLVGKPTPPWHIP